jgi:YfiH family protein
VTVAKPLTHALLAGLGVEHGFGVRGFVEPAGLRRPKQVHGREVVNAARFPDPSGTAFDSPSDSPSDSPFDSPSDSPTESDTGNPIASEPGPFEADAIVSARSGVGVAVVTADCVPILLADGEAGVVAAVHAGWRGLASGVITSSISELCALGADPSRLIAVVGPYIGPCCYEVDEPVLTAFAGRFASVMQAATHPTRAGHARVDLGAFAAAELISAGLLRANIGSLEGVCTSCDDERFHSYRRDGARAGRMLHFIRCPIQKSELTPESNPAAWGGRPQG